MRGKRRSGYQVVAIAIKAVVVDVIMSIVYSNGNVVCMICYQVVQKLFGSNAECKHQHYYQRRKKPYGLLFEQIYILLLCCKFIRFCLKRQDLF